MFSHTKKKFHKNTEPDFIIFIQRAYKVKEETERGERGGQRKGKKERCH